MLFFISFGIFIRCCEVFLSHPSLDLSHKFQVCLDVRIIKPSKKYNWEAICFLLYGIYRGFNFRIKRLFLYFWKSKFALSILRSEFRSVWQLIKAIKYSFLITLVIKRRGKYFTSQEDKLKMFNSIWKILFNIHILKREGASCCVYFKLYAIDIYSIFKILSSFH